MSKFPEEYFYDLTGYCNYRSRKDAMAESKLDLEKDNTWEKAEIHCIEEGMKLLVIELNFLFKKKILYLK